MRKFEFVNGEYYHIYSRGVDKRQIFNDAFDYERFLESIYVFNDSHYVDKGDHFGKILKLAGHEIFSDEYDPWVKIIAFTLMPNHYHFFVQQLKDDGISRFFHKLNMRHSQVYNKANNRSGALFESRFKAKHIGKQEYFDHILVYIHLNILDLSTHDWRDGFVKDWDGALKFMDAYQWSSHFIYRQLNSELPLIQQETINEFFKTPEQYIESLQSWSTRSLEFLAVTGSQNL